MKTELHKIKEAVNIYEGYKESSHKEWEEAQRYLIRVHKQYATIDTKIIANLIR